MVTSEPVPAVMGITNRGNDGRRDLNSPISSRGERLLVASSRGRPHRQRDIALGARVLSVVRC